MEKNKLSFSLLASSSSKSKPTKKISISGDNHFNNDQEEEAAKNTKRQFVTEFDPSKTLADEDQQIVIPPKKNTWRSSNNNKTMMMNIDLLPLLRAPSDDPDLTFELEAPTTAGDTDPNVSYGLNLRNNNNNNNDDDGLKKKQQQQQQQDTPHPHPPVENLMLKKFKEDMMNLPDDRGFDEFADVPVEDFAAALLRGYGWSEGKGIGRNPKEVKVVQYVRRGDREGLGFEPDANVKNNNNSKGAQRRNSGTPQLVAPKGPDGRTRHVVGVDEKLVPREQKGICVGKVVRIVGGRHEGLKGKVVEKLDASSTTRYVLNLVKSGEDVTVKADELAELDSVEEEKCLRRLQEFKRRGGSKDESSRRRHEDGRESSRGKGRESKGDRASSDKKRRIGEGVKHEAGVSSKRSRDGAGKGADERRREPMSWLTSHIRVRIVNKDFKGGKLYLKKGRILDVVGPTVCDISMDESNELIQGVDQSLLETAIPKRGGPVLILSGRHKGVYGNLVQKDMDKETGVVQDADSHELLNVGLEQIAEYIGDPSYIGY